ncbi:MAG: hypothetical protein M3Y50_11645 [Acidobacteriota bacterium]|nr:hypothetical protein [Acidobacteriota bacterium]
METEGQNQESRCTRLLSCYLEANQDDGLGRDSVMLCEMIGEEIQTISLRVAADAMLRWKK